MLMRGKLPYLYGKTQAQGGIWATEVNWGATLSRRWSDPLIHGIDRSLTEEECVTSQEVGTFSP